MADGCHFKNCYIAISQSNIVQFWWNLVHYIIYWTWLQSRNQKLKFLKFKMAATAILKIAFFGHNSSADCPILAKFCMRKQNGMSTRAAWQNLQIFKMQDGGWPPFWKSLNRHISLKNRPILMKFGTLQQMLNLITVTLPKIEILKFNIVPAAILKIAFLTITHQPIVWFQINFALKRRAACRQRPRDKNCKFLKSKMADGRHFENC